jgi:hypothetical protein
MASIELRNATEILGMGGPGRGELFIDGALIDAEVMEEPLCDTEGLWCVYVVYRCATRWRKDVHFWLHAYQLSTGRIVRFDRDFDMVVLCEVGSRTALVKHAFHKDYKGEVLELPLPQLDKTNRAAPPWKYIE